MLSQAFERLTSGKFLWYIYGFLSKMFVLVNILFMYNNLRDKNLTFETNHKSRLGIEKFGKSVQHCHRLLKD